MSFKVNTLLCDIDGVIVDAQPIYDQVDSTLPGPVDAQHHAAYDDIAEQAKVSLASVAMLKTFKDSGLWDIFFVTARSERIRPKTESLLKDLNLLDDSSKLLMRIEPYDVPSTEVKRRQILEIIDRIGTIPDIFIDDSSDNCRVALSLGIHVLRTQCFGPVSINMF